MESDKRARVEAWLRYGADLELGPYYRDRASSRPIVETNQALGAQSADSRRSLQCCCRALEHQVQAPPSVFRQPRKQQQRPRVRPSPRRSPQRHHCSKQATASSGDTFQLIRETIGDCTRCKLHKARTNIVFGVGSMKAELVFVGEGPGHDEDIKGEPFVGRAGKLLTQMIEAMGLRREDVYICNVVKCRPPENRLPEKDEVTTCSPFLFRQIDVIRPKVICCLGSCASQTLLQTTQGISRFRGEWFDFRGSKLIATYHPAYLLRNPNAKGEVWKDLQKVMTVLGLQPKRK